ncbi:MAG: hypothetical protein N2517_02110 [Ignavibacteria bacterium]|nr:hypothetical protein [Ignavibacteria bacterium]
MIRSGYSFSILLFEILFVFSLVLFYSCEKPAATSNLSEEKDFSVPPKGFPPIPFPKENPYSRAKFELGRRLFYEKLLVRDSSFKSCSHCLKQEYNFDNNIPNTLGYNRIAEFRTTMTLTNVAYYPRLFWDGRLEGAQIERVAYRSMFLPYIFGNDTNVINSRLTNHPIYPKLFRETFGENAKPSAWLAAQAIATFVRCLVSGNSAYDRYIRGDSNALTASQKRGMVLFFSERTNCSVCHSGFLFSDFKFHNTGNTLHYFDLGRFYVTGRYEDRYKFMTPSLRNVEVSAPYMHHGMFKTLEEVLESYNRGGFPSINKDSIVKPLNLNEQEKQDLINFLKSLTDWNFLRNPDFSEPKW